MATTITTKEYAVLTAMVTNDFLDGRHPVGAELWLDDVLDNAGLAEASRGGVVASLVKKSFVTIGGDVEPNGPEMRDERCITLTQHGYDAYVTVATTELKVVASRDLDSAEPRVR